MEQLRITPWPRGKDHVRSSGAGRAEQRFDKATEPNWVALHRLVDQLHGLRDDEVRVMCEVLAEIRLAWRQRTAAAAALLPIERVVERLSDTRAVVLVPMQAHGVDVHVKWQLLACVRDDPDTADKC